MPSASLSDTTLALNGGAGASGVSLVGSANALDLDGTNVQLTGVHTLNVENTLQVGGVAVATTEYVESYVYGRSWLQAVRLASTANVNTSTDLQAGDSIDGVVLVAGDRVLLKDQSTASQNGIYVAVSSGAASRAGDLDTGAQAANVAVFVQEGTTLFDTAFVCTNNTDADTVGTDGLVFTQFGGNATIADGSITSAKFAAGAVNTAALGAGQVTSAKLAAGAVVTAAIGDGQVTTAKFAAGSVDTAALGAGQVTSAKLAAGAVVTAAIGDGEVTTAKFAAGSVDTAALGAGQVTSAKLAAGAVVTAAIGDAQVTTAKFAAGSVDTAALGAGQVTTAKLAAGAVATASISDAAVTGPKIATAFAGAGMVHNGTSLDSTHQTLDPVHCATTANITIATALVGGQTLDGLTLATGQRVLVKNQTTASQNGIYVVAATPVRANDIQTARSDQLRLGAMVFVALGTANIGTTWRLSASGATPPTPPTIDTHTLTFAQVQITNANVSATAAIVASKIAPGTFGAGNYVLVGDMSATTFTATSDQRKKRNIEEIDADKALESICKARGVTFEWEDSKAKCAGVIAQEIQEFAPELVKTDDQSFLSLNYDGLNGYLFASLKALNDRLEKLEKSPQKRKLANTMCECACACNQDGSSSPAKRPNV
jgi:hypothetical protein